MPWSASNSGRHVSRIRPDWKTSSGFADRTWSKRQRTLRLREEELITEERLKKAEAYIEEEEGPSRRLIGRMDTFITVVAVTMSLVHLYAAVGVIMTQILRGIHVMFALFLIFLVFPSSKRVRNRILWYDYLLLHPGGCLHCLHVCRF